MLLTIALDIFEDFKIFNFDFRLRAVMLIYLYDNCLKMFRILNIGTDNIKKKIEAMKMINQKKIKHINKRNITGFLTRFKQNSNLVLAIKFKGTENMNADVLHRYQTPKGLSHCSPAVSPRATDLPNCFL